MADDYDRIPLIPQTHPWLLISHGRDHQRHAFYSISGDRFYTREIPFLRKKICLCSCYGWLVNQDMETLLCYIFNPVSMEIIELPPIMSMGLLYRAALSKPPSDPDCHILVTSFVGSFRSIAFCKLGDDRFVESEEIMGSDSLSTVMGWKGKIYGLMVPSYTFVTVEIVGSNVQIIPLIKDGLTCQISLDPLPPGNFSFDEYLVESGEELWLVYKIYSASFSPEVTHFKVFRVDTSDMICEELIDIGERVIFLNKFYGLSCLKTEPGVRGNCIYYTEQHDNRLYRHNLEDRSRQLKLPCPMTRRDAILCWISAV